MTAGELATRWTIRVALSLYAIAIALRLQPGGRPGRERAARAAWAAGLLFYLAHVACAFQFFHNWSHQAAYRETARRTGELFGFDWGGGLYWNYAFTAAWAVDVLWPRPPGWLRAGLRGFLAFLAFQATVVFGAGWTRWAGLASTLALLLLWRRNRHDHRAR